MMYSIYIVVEITILENSVTSERWKRAPSGGLNDVSILSKKFKLVDGSAFAMVANFEFPFPYPHTIFFLAALGQHAEKVETSAI